MKFSHNILHTYSFILGIKTKKSKICEKWVVDMVAGFLNLNLPLVQLSIFYICLSIWDYTLAIQDNQSYLYFKMVWAN